MPKCPRLAAAADASAVGGIDASAGAPEAALAIGLENCRVTALAKAGSGAASSCGAAPAAAGDGSEAGAEPNKEIRERHAGPDDLSPPGLRPVYSSATAITPARATAA